jgi:hypothetical protein
MVFGDLRKFTTIFSRRVLSQPSASDAMTSIWMTRATREYSTGTCPSSCSVMHRYIVSTERILVGYESFRQPHPTTHAISKQGGKIENAERGNLGNVLTTLR